MIVIRWFFSLLSSTNTIVKCNVKLWDILWTQFFLKRIPKIDNCGIPHFNISGKIPGFKWSLLVISLSYISQVLNKWVNLIRNILFIMPKILNTFSWVSLYTTYRDIRGFLMFYWPHKRIRIKLEVLLWSLVSRVQGPSPKRTYDETWERYKYTYSVYRME